MRQPLSILLITLLFLLSSPATSAAAPAGRQSVGLVLSGGGAKGIAHIGVIQALEENNIPIDYVTGTSMGAIVAGLYAAGYTPQEMMNLILSPEFAYWSTGRIDPTLSYYFNREPESPTMASMPLPHSSAAADSVPASLISGIPMGFAFMDLFAAYTAQCGGDFNKLFVPFRSVASNAVSKRKHVFRGGRFSDAIRCSMSFPIVFQPIAVNDTLLYDGGIYDNFPVDVMREDFAPSIMIGVNVSSSDNQGPQTSIMDQLEQLIIQGQVEPIPHDEGIYMRVDVDQYSLLDFPLAKAIYKIGYNKAMSMMDTIKARVTVRTNPVVLAQRRGAFKSQTPYLRFNRVNVTGGTPSQNEYISYLFKPTSDESDTIGIAKARQAFYRAVSTGKIAALFPQATYNDTTGLFTLDMKASVKGRYKGSIGGYITSSTSSYLYASVGYSSMSFRSIETTLGAWLGQTTMAAAFNGRMYLHTPVPSALGVQGVVSRTKFFENDNVFYTDNAPSFVVNREAFGRLFWSVAAGSFGAVDIGAGYGGEQDSYRLKSSLFNTDSGDRISSRLNLWQAFARFSGSTLDEVSFPRRGMSLQATAMAVSGRSRVQVNKVESVNEDQQWAQVEFAGRFYPSLSSKFTLGLESDIMLSTRKLLPTYAASIASAPGYNPTPSSNNSFHSSFRANSFVAAGIVPVYKVNANISARIGGYLFAPLREICEQPLPLRSIGELSNSKAEYGPWFGNMEILSEAALAWHFPFGTLAGYVNYSTHPGTRWNAGLSLGVFVLPPRFLR